jgi:signal transduction histidine kinase
MMGGAEENIPSIILVVDDSLTVLLQLQKSLEFAGFTAASVKKIIEAHNGRPWVESVEGVGSAFFFTLPIAPQPIVSPDQESALL